MVESSFEWKGKGHFDGSHSLIRIKHKKGFDCILTLVRDLDGVLVCTGFNIEYPENLGIPKQTINSTFLQKLGFGELLTKAREIYMENNQILKDIREEDLVNELLADWTGMGPLGFPDEKYAALAWKYEYFVMLGLEQPVTALAEYLKSDKTTISGRIIEARKRNLLTTPKKGNYGGKLTNKGKKLLGIEVVNAKKNKQKPWHK